MKKIFLTTTALVMTAGAASAEVAVTGFAEMGLYVAESKAAAGDVEFFTDIDATLTMTGETDSGLSFGAALDLDEAAGAATTDNSDDGGIAIFVSGGFGVTLGDTDGALDWAMTETGIGGALADDHTEHAGYNGNSHFDGTGDGQVLRYEYSFDAFSVAVSAEQGDNGIGVADDIVGLGFKYSVDLGGTDVALGLGYQDAGTGNEMLGLSAAATLGNGLQAILNYSDGEIATVDTSHIGLGLGYTMDALTVGFNWGEYDRGGVKTDGYGLAVNYDLGGGAVAQFGYGSDDSATASDDYWSLGLALSF